VGGLGVVYIGNRWVVTAAHVGTGTVVFGGVSHDAVPGSTVTFETAPGQLADLIVFKLRDDPGVPAVSIASATPPVGTAVVMIGDGRDRGAATQWSGIDGWYWGTTYTKRWGTNLVGSTPAPVAVTTDVPHVTRAFWTDFTKSPPPQVTAQEAQAADGDSGGALFAKNTGTWQLGGLLFAIAGYANQPAAALYGDATYVIDLAFYRSAILAVTTKPDCSDGLDDDGDGLTDYPADPGCSSASDLDEHSPLLPCDDGVDNDGDGLIDYRVDGTGDPGCRNVSSTTESPQCQDGIDNDGDGKIDFDGGASANHGVALAAPDLECSVPWHDIEKPSSGGCGLGAELAVLIPLLARWRRRTRAA
jgi:hypothetical protein